MDTQKRILLTGATGAIGSAVLAEIYPLYAAENITVLLRPSRKANKLLKRYPGLRVVHGSINDQQAVAAACAMQDAVIHLAGVIPPHYDKQPASAYRSNVDGTRTVVDAIKTHAPSAFFLFSSSVAVYGDRLKNPMIHIDDPLPDDMEDGYANSKIDAEAIVRDSGINWCIFRLTAIMGLGNHKVSKIVFHVPLETPLEIATVRDTARAFRLALDHEEQLLQRSFNLSGGNECRVLYKDFLAEAFQYYGLGKLNFPENSFARANFHCGFFRDADELEEILRFRRDTLESYLAEFKSSIPMWMRISASCFRTPVKFALGRLSEPRKALRKGDREKIRLFFGESEP